MPQIQYRKLRGYKYQTTHHTSCQLPKDLFTQLPEGATIATRSKFVILSLPQRCININKGYCWDGPSGPTIDTDSFMRGSLFHDAWYQIFREYEYYRGFKDDADRMLQRHCIEDGMYRWRANLVYWGVKTFGGRSAGR